MIFDKMFKNENSDLINIFDVIFGGENSKEYIYTIAEAKAINLISQFISKTEILTYEMNKEKKIEENRGEIYWRLNIQPNFIENGTMFLKKLVIRLLVDKEALIIMNDNGKETKLLYIADDFDCSNSILYGKTYKNIIISDHKGNSLPVEKQYGQDNSIYYSIANEYFAKAKDSFKINTGKLLGTISKKYMRENSAKWKLKRPGQQMPLKDAETGKDLSYEDYKKKITEGLISEEDTVVMLSEMFDLINLNKDNNTSLGDYKDIVKQIGDTVANLYGIPLDIFYGSKTEKSTGNDDFITFAIDPILELIEDGFNLGLVGKKNYLKGEKIMFNRFSMQHKDILDAANGIDKLTGDGFSRNEINKFLKLPQINEDWANKHNLTKNYGNMKGGAEEDGE